MSSGSSSSSSSTGSEPPPARRIPYGPLIAFLAVTVGLAFVFGNLNKTRPSSTPSHLQRVSEVPEFTFTTEQNEPLHRDDLKGQIWVANFIFTRCQGPCPLVTSRMTELNRKLGKAAGNVRLITFTVDPDYDQPAVLAEYASRVGAEPGRWTFLTGPKEEIDAFVIKGMLQPLAKDADGLPAHSTRFVLVDRDGWLRGFQDGMDPEVVQKLLMDIGDLLREKPAAPQEG